MSSNKQSRTGVSAEITLGLVGPEEGLVPLLATLAYTSADPFAVTIAFHVDSDESVEWALARDLLASCLHGRAGIGDFQGWPSDEIGEIKILNMSMTSPFGHAQFEAFAEDVSNFLNRTYELVPDGDESAYLDFDEELAALLSEA